MASAMLPSADRPIPLAIFGPFLRLGFFAWGGPVAQMAMIQSGPELADPNIWAAFTLLGAWR